MDEKPASGTGGGQRVRQAVDLQQEVSHRLAAYLVAAGAAGVGLLAMAPAAQAGIIYTPSNATFLSGFGTVGISLENNGVINFNIASGYRGGYIKSVRVNGNGVNGDGVLGFASGIFGPEASALAKGAVIGPGQVFQNANHTTGGVYGNVGLQMAAETFGRFIYGPWANVSDRYLGLQFDVSGQTYYGWIGFSFVGEQSSQFGLTASLFGYAYNNVPNQQILAGQTAATPEPGTLGLLALGSVGLGFWRRKRVSAASRPPSE
jgi:PEP-CTERM motif